MDAIQLLETSIWPVVKVAILFFLFLYTLFALVMVKQINLMTATLQVGFELPVKVVAYFHLVFALGVFLLTLLI